MKKIILFFTFLFAFLLSSVGFASCNLDTSRWEWVTSNDNFGAYIDTRTLKYSNNFAEVWVCLYFPYSCESHPNVGEHYHYNLQYIYYGNNSTALKSYIDRDKNGNTLDSYTFQYVERIPITPDSIGESIAIAVRKRATRRY